VSYDTFFYPTTTELPDFVTYPTTTGSVSTTFHYQERNNRVNLTVKTVELKAGWVGQVKDGARIVWESKPKKSGLKAEKAAIKARERAVARLFEDN
jgi:hypothetical protein